MMNNICIYLAGTTNEILYRETITKFFLNYSEKNVITKDPLVLIDQYLPAKELVLNDKILIVGSDILLAKVEKYSAGTMMEICFAYENNLFVWIISNNESIKKDPWIVAHCDRFFNNEQEFMKIFK